MEPEEVAAFCVPCWACGEETAPDDVLRRGIRPYCPSCYNETFTDCCDCGDTICREDAIWRQSQPYCSGCHSRPEFIAGKACRENPSTRFVGIEYEYLADEDESGADDTAWGVHTSDGSLSDDDGYGTEFRAFPASGDALVRSIRQVCASLSHAWVNRSCGLHVHVDARDLSIAERNNIDAWWTMLEPVIHGMVSPSRRGGEYCRTSRHCSKGSRYRSLNRCSPHGTLEFRLHQGTLDSVRVLGWARLCLAFVETCRHVPMSDAMSEQIDAMRDREKLILLFQTLQLPLSLKKYMARRIRKFNASHKAEHGVPLLNLAKVA